MNDMKIIEALENSGILLKVVTKAIENETKEKRGGFLSMLLGTLVLGTYDSIMCGYFCIEFINYMFDGKSLIDFTSLFSPHDFKKNDQINKRIFKK